jgi:hypothetical protein
LLAGALLPVAYSTWVGGDAWEQFGFANRYVTPVAPWLLLSVASGAAAGGPLRWRDAAQLAAAGAAWLAIAVGAALAQKQNGTVEWMAWLAIQAALILAFAIVAMRWRRAMGEMSPVASAILVAIPAIALVNAEPMAYWTLRNAHEQRADAVTTTLGLHLREHLAADAVIAVVRAGNTPYFAERRAIDLLGKTDPAIARSRPVYPFMPGHDKRDWAHSIGAGRPDVVAHVWWNDAGDEAELASYGYRRLANNLWVRRDSRKIQPGLDRLDPLRLTGR